MDLSDIPYFSPRVIYAIASPYLKPDLDHDLLPSLLLDPFYSNPQRVLYSYKWLHSGRLAEYNPIRIYTFRSNL